MPRVWRSECHWRPRRLRHGHHHRQSADFGVVYRLGERCDIGAGCTGLRLTPVETIVQFGHGKVRLAAGRKRIMRATFITLAAVLLVACTTERNARCVVTPTNLVECQ